MKNNKDKQINILKKLGVWMIGVLIIQYVLGMTSNLFVSFPTDGNPGLFWQFAWHQIPTALHIIVGTLLFVFSIVILVIAMKQKVKRWITAGIIGIISIFVAAFAGAQFVSTQSNVFSYVMSLFFIIAFISYSLAISDLF